MNVGRCYAGVTDGQVNFGGGRAFLLGNRSATAETKALVLAESLHSQSQWGGEPRIPLGIEAGPVRYSPFHFRRAVTLIASEELTESPKNTPDTSEHGESAPENRKTALGIPREIDQAPTT